MVEQARQLLLGLHERLRLPRCRAPSRSWAAVRRGTSPIGVPLCAPRTPIPTPAGCQFRPLYQQPQQRGSTQRYLSYSPPRHQTLGCYIRSLDEFGNSSVSWLFLSPPPPPTPPLTSATRPNPTSFRIRNIKVQYAVEFFISPSSLYFFPCGPNFNHNVSPAPLPSKGWHGHTMVTSWNRLGLYGFLLDVPMYSIDSITGRRSEVVSLVRGRGVSCSRCIKSILILCAEPWRGGAGRSGVTGPKCSAARGGYWEGRCAARAKRLWSPLLGAPSRAVPGTIP